MSALDQLLLKKYRESVKVGAGRADTAWSNDPARETPPVEAGPGPVLGDGVTPDPAVGEVNAGSTVFKPDWEVDQFRWPQVCRQLTDRLGTRMDEAIERLQGQCGSQRNVLIVTSSRRQVGRSTLTLCLVRRAAQRGLRVAVVDLDHQNPCLMSMLGVAADVGMESLCQGTETAESICITALQDGVSLLPIARSTANAPWTWGELWSALRVVAAHHDLVFLDAPPARDWQDLGLSRDAALAVGAIIVQDLRDSTEQELDRLASRLREGRVWTAGVVENFAA